MKATKHSLLMSITALILCASMLIGTTFAWFTDTVTSTGNIIKSGTLKVSLEWLDGKVDPITAEDDDWKNAESGAIFNSELWEPGYTEVRHIKIENEGSLALKYALNIIPFDKDGNAIYDFSQLEEDGVKLSDVIDVYYIDSDLKAIDERTDLPESKKLGTLTDVLTNFSATANGELKETENHTVTLALKMKESAGNEYQNKSIGTTFAIQLLATQLASEKDSIDINYDINALYPATGFMTAAGQSSYEVEIKNNNSGVKVGTALVHASSVADGVDIVKIICNETAYKADVVITDGYTAKAVDISVEGLKENNTEPVTIELYVGKALDPDTFKLYHYDDEILCTYNPHDGYVTFESTDFSPFTIVYDANSEYVPTDPDVPDLPKATVERKTEYENVDLKWGGYGQWSPTPGLDSQLESAFLFECVDTPEEASKSPYADWYCDFYVMLDRNLGANEIFLGGNYGSFEWIGFHNGDITLEANTEFPLLGSIAGPWTYQQIAALVGEFICGVGDVDDALAGATFTVMLRLTNPEDDSEYYNVATIKHTFEGPKVNAWEDIYVAESDITREDQAAEDYVEINHKSGNMTLKNITFKNGLTIYTNNTENNGTITLEDCTIYLNNGEGDPAYSGRTQHTNGYGLKLNLANGSDITFKFKNCVFTAADDYVYNGGNSYNVYIGGGYSAKSITFEKCTFEKSGKHGIGCSSEGGSQYYTLEVTGCKFKDWKNDTTINTGSAIRGNLPSADFKADITISGNTFGNNNGSTYANVYIGNWTGTWS